LQIQIKHTLATFWRFIKGVSIEKYWLF